MLWSILRHDPVLITTSCPPHLTTPPLSSLPMFMRDVLHYDLDTSGFLAAFPYILMAVVVQVNIIENKQ